MLERIRYCERPARYEYRLTARGRDFGPVLVALLAYGNRHFAPEGPSVHIVDAQTGHAAEPILVDARTGRPLTDPNFVVVPGSAAGEALRKRFDARPRRALLPASPSSGTRTS